MIKEGDKVLVSVPLLGLYKAKAVVTYIDRQFVFDHWTSPVQVELEEPYEDNQTTLRVSLLEVEKI